MEYYLALKRNELLDMKKHGGNLNAYWKKPIWKCQSTYCMISTIWDSGRGKTIETLKTVVAMGLGRGKRDEYVNLNLLYINISIISANE